MSDSDLENVFLTAAGNGNLEKLRECVENGVNVNCVGDRNKKYTALHKACSKNNLDCVKYLIEQGADVNAEAENNITPLHVAAEGAHVDVIRELITKVSDVNKCTSAKSGGDTALHWLLKNPPTAGRNTQSDIKQIVNILHKHGANLDATNADENSTALHLCVKNKYPEIIKELLRLNADPTIEDKDFRSPRKLAIFQGAEEETAKAFENPSGLHGRQTIEADGCRGDDSRVGGTASPSWVVNPGRTPLQVPNQSPTQNITNIINYNFNERVSAVVVGDSATVNTLKPPSVTDKPS